jgi:hypothetical protein
VTSPSATPVFQQLLLFSALMSWALACPAADAVSAVPGAHGPQLMLYIKQSLGTRGAPRVYGLRIERLATPPTLPTPASIVSTGRREIVDLQIRQSSDVRVEFGRRVTWNVGRQEFGLSGNQPSMVMHFPARANSSAIAARAP